MPGGSPLDRVPRGRGVSWHLTIHIVHQAYPRVECGVRMPRWLTHTTYFAPVDKIRGAHGTVGKSIGLEHGEVKTPLKIGSDFYWHRGSSGCSYAPAPCLPPCLACLFLMSQQQDNTVPARRHPREVSIRGLEDSYSVTCISVHLHFCNTTNGGTSAVRAHPEIWYHLSGMRKCEMPSKTNGDASYGEKRL